MADYATLTLTANRHRRCTCRLINNSLKTFFLKKKKKVIQQRRL